MKLTQKKYEILKDAVVDSVKETGEEGVNVWLLYASVRWLEGFDKEMFDLVLADLFAESRLAPRSRERVIFLASSHSLRSNQISARPDVVGSVAM